MRQISKLQAERLRYQPRLPEVLKDLSQVTLSPGLETGSKGHSEELKKLFPHLFGQPIITIDAKRQAHSLQESKPLCIGVVLSGGQAPGGHNVIAGLFDALQKIHPKSRLVGFLNGPSGIVGNESVEITSDLLSRYRNLGGFDIIGSGRTKIETKEQLAAALKTVKAEALDGLIIIGGDDSNTNAAVLAEYFISNQCTTKVIGVPKTIDGDLKNEYIELSFGFDTACKVYSEMIGNLMRDALSAKKYTHFIKLMGRSASHIALECAFQTHPNCVLIGEEVAALKKTLVEITHEIADVICRRAAIGRNYGVILIPEGLIEFIPEFTGLIKALNTLLAPSSPHSIEIERMLNIADKAKYLCQHLDKEAANCFVSIPEEIQRQLLLDRDPHGNVQVAHIDTEKLLVYTVKEELKRRGADGRYKGKCDAVAHYFGYEGRSAMPSNFDSNYCYALGYVAAMLVRAGATGYMSALKGLNGPVEGWRPMGIPLTMMMHLEERHGRLKPVIQKALVDLSGKPFVSLVGERDKWAVDDDYGYPGPIQFFGDREISDSGNETLSLEHAT